MEIKSRAFNDGDNISSRYTCDGDDINPPLEILDIPQEAKTLALVVDDPDAPNKTWVHWLLWNMLVDGETYSIEENNPPKEAVYGKNDFDKFEYGGPCPPSGTHRYFFKVYALDRELQIPEGATKDELLNAIEQYKINSAQLMGVYSRM
jgi:Raf kinase inhibitor-like YbhB/YbcL family protein